MPARRSRPRMLLAVFLDDGWRKIAAILLAVLLWLYLDRLVTSDETVTLEPMTIAVDATDSAIGARQLGVTLDLDRYSDLGFRDPEKLDAFHAPEELTSVKLFLHGPTRLLDELPEQARFRAIASVQDGPRGPVATVTVEDVRAVDERFSGLVSAMEPPRVLIELATNDSAVLPLSTRLIEIREIDSALAGRMRIDDARFDPAAVTIRGPKPAIDRLRNAGGPILRIRPDSLTPDEGVLRAPLVLIDGSDKVRLDSVPVVEIPLSSAGRTFELRNVPVVLHAPAELAGAFRLRRPTENVEIVAMGSLEARLSGMTPEALRKWTQDTAMIVARLPDDADTAGFLYWPDAFLCLGPEALEGRDFRLPEQVTIHYEPTDR